MSFDHKMPQQLDSSVQDILPNDDQVHHAFHIKNNANIFAAVGTQNDVSSYYRRLMKHQNPTKSKSMWTME